VERVGCDDVSVIWHRSPSDRVEFGAFLKKRGEIERKGGGV